MQVTSKALHERHKPFIESRFTRGLKNCLHPLLMKVAQSSITFKIVKDNEIELLDNRPVLYVANHYCGQDLTITSNVIKERVMIVAGVQNLSFIDEFFFHANGVIFLDRKDKEDGKFCKEAMIEHLKSNQNVLIFPEGTSNVSDALLMYRMRWGVIDVAKKANAQIVPIILDYNKELKECHVSYLKPLVFDDLSLLEGINLLRDNMATKRYEYIESYPMLHRDKMNIDELRKENMELLLSYKYLDYEYEKSVVYTYD